MGDESEVNDQMRELIEYLGDSSYSNSTFSSENKEEDNILNSITEAFRDNRKFFVEIVKSFDLENLNSVFIYIYRQLTKNGIKIKLLKNLNFGNIESESKGKFLYLITEKYLDISNKETLNKLISLISGHLPDKLMGIPVLLGLTENTLRYLDKYRAENVQTTDSKNEGYQITHSLLIGLGFILFSTTFFVTLIGIVIDRPNITIIGLSFVYGIVFAASLIGISGFILLILGSWNFQKTKVRVIEKVILVIAACEAASILLQLSIFSITSQLNGLHLTTIIPIGTASSSELKVAGFIPIVYSIISIIIAAALYFLVHSFSTRFFKKVVSVALYSGIIAELLSILVTLRGVSGYNLQYFILYDARYFFLSFYNNVSPVMPFPSVTLNTADFLFTFGKYSTGFFYFILLAASVSNILFFFSFLFTGMKMIKKRPKQSLTWT